MQTKTKTECCEKCERTECHHGEEYKEDWEKEFDKTWKYKLYNLNDRFGIGSYATCGEDVKSFIRNLLANQKSETIKEIIEMVEKMKHEISMPMDYCYGCETGGENCYVNPVLSKLITKLKESKQ